MKDKLEKFAEPIAATELRQSVAAIVRHFPQIILSANEILDKAKAIKNLQQNEYLEYPEEYRKHKKKLASHVIEICSIEIEQEWTILCNELEAYKQNGTSATELAENATGVKS